MQCGVLAKWPAALQCERGLEYDRQNGNRHGCAVQHAVCRHVSGTAITARAESVGAPAGDFD